MQQYIIMLLVILLIIIVYYAYILGKTKQENKQYKSSNKLQKKINNIKKIDKKDLIKILKKGKFILIFGLFIINSCSSLNNNLYIPLQSYTQQEQKDLADFLENNNIEIIDKMIMDYGELREKVRVVNGDS